MSSTTARRILILGLTTATLLAPPLAIRAIAEPCFATDNDGTFDQDGTVNGVITITGASTSAVPSAPTGYDCATLDFVVQSGGLLSFGGDEVSGAVASLDVANLTIVSGGAIRADGTGCVVAFNGGLFAEPPEAPDASNVCVVGAPGSGGNGNDFGGGGGGGHGGAGASGGIGAGGTTYGSATAPLRFGATGGGTNGTGGGAGGAGGGVVHITADTLTHDGVISADGFDGGGTIGRAAGGGAGGSIFVEVTTLGGTTGTFEARGGDAPGTAGGGGGGRIAIVYGSGSFDFDASDFDVDGGVGGTTGTKGTVYVEESSTSSVQIFHGFTFTDVDHVEESWSADASATNQYCDLTLASDATPSITAANIVLGGALDCARQVTSFDIVQTAPGGVLSLADAASVSVNGALSLDAATTLDVGVGTSIANTLEGADLTLALPDGDDQSWSNVTIDAAAGGQLVLDAVIALELLDGTVVGGNAQWPNLTALTIDATSTLHADGKGCAIAFIGGLAAEPAEAPDASNVCVARGPGAGGNGNDFGGGGGGGHGGAGASGGVGASGTTYGSATVPVLFGATGGETNGVGGGAGGAGGGAIRISADSVSHNGVIRAHGLTGGGTAGRAGGGGAGGSIFIEATTLDGATGAFEAAGGDAVGTAGGGGGGRIALVAENVTFDFDATDFDVDGGVGGSVGAKGTAYVRESSTSTVQIFHGFAFADVDHVEETWLTDPSATNQYCDVTLAPDATPSVTAESIVIGGAIDCDVEVTSFGVVQTGPSGTLAVGDGANVSVNGDLLLQAATSLEVGAGATIATTLIGADLLLVLPDGDDQSWSNVEVQGSAEGRVLIDAAIALELVDSTVVAGNPHWPSLTGLTIDATSSIDADATGCTTAFNSNSPEPSEAPNCDNVCTPGATGAGGNGNDFGGSGGGGHGGAGGAGGVGAGGATYDYARIPRLFGATGGGVPNSGAGGAGGGVVRINVSGTLSNDGTISARGGSGGGSTGGGAGGSINLVANTYTCTLGGSFSVGGGDAAGVAVSGGGGGGRIVVDAGADTCIPSPLSLLASATTAAGGLAVGGGQNGSAGSVSLDAQSLACADPLGFTTTRNRTERASFVNATDALFVLRSSVGLECCDLCACDVNGSTDITATDALITLKVAVGEALPLECPPCS